MYGTILELVLIYGSSICAISSSKDNFPERIIKNLKMIQRKRLKYFTGANLPTSMGILWHKTPILLMKIYAKHRRVLQAGLNRDLPARKTIGKTCHRIRQQNREKQNCVFLSKERGRKEWCIVFNKIESIERWEEKGDRFSFQGWAYSWPHQNQKPQVIEPEPIPKVEHQPNST